jgi:GrpB-like predicted nucleotidyltransferase (UPF0157 family)
MDTLTEANDTPRSEGCARHITFSLFDTRLHHIGSACVACDALFTTAGNPSQEFRAQLRSDWRLRRSYAHLARVEALARVKEALDARSTSEG